MTETAPTIELEEVDPWEELNPCRICGKHQFEAPEREARHSLTCWKCGFDPRGVFAQQVRNASSAQINVGTLVEQVRSAVVEDLIKALTERGMLGALGPAKTAEEPTEAQDVSSAPSETEVS